MIVSVDQVEINSGYRHNCYHCPVAMAIQKNYSYPNYIRVDSGRFTVFSKTSMKEYTYDLPSHVVRWIQKFDSGQEVKPFEFELDV